MSNSEAAVSGDVACLNELIRIIGTHRSEAKLLREHKPDATGHCRVCRSVGCTLYSAALEVQKIRAKHDKKLGGSKA